MTDFPEEALRQDQFLGGALTLWQPRQGYRAGIDPVLLAASVAARAGQSVLDLGCGAGAAALCLGQRVSGLRLAGVERHAGYAALARRNGEAAGQRFEVWTADLAELPAEVKALSFDHVIANPPYFDRRTGTAAPDEDREAALGEDTALETWIQVAAKRLKPWGYAHIIHKADRLGDALAAITPRLGSIEIIPLAPRAGRAAELVILRARKEGRAKLQLKAPVLLHIGDSHPGDKDHYTPQIADVLRRGAALTI